MNDTLKFVLICFLAAGGMVALSRLYEHLFLRSRRELSVSRRITTIALCAAMGSLLMLLEFPLLFLAPEFYKLDLSELPVMLCGLYLGPSAGVTAELLKVLLKLLIKGTTTAYVGELANFIVGCSLILPATMIYFAKRTKRAAVFGLLTGTLCIAVVGSLFNAFYLLPAFSALFHLPLAKIIAMGSAVNASIRSVSTFVLFAVAPLNLIKGAVVSMLTMLLYKRTEKLLFQRK